MRMKPKRMPTIQVHKSFQLLEMIEKQRTHVRCPKETECAWLKRTASSGSSHRYQSKKILRVYLPNHTCFVLARNTLSSRSSSPVTSFNLLRSWLDFVSFRVRSVSDQLLFRFVNTIYTYTEIRVGPSRGRPNRDDLRWAYFWKSKRPLPNCKCLQLLCCCVRAPETISLWIILIYIYQGGALANRQKILGREHPYVVRHLFLSTSIHAQCRG